MSKTIDSLARARQQKNKKYTSVLDKQVVEEATIPENITLSRTQGSLQINKWVIGGFIIGLIILINFGLIFKLFMLQKVKGTEITTSVKGLERVEKSLDDINQQIRIISDDLNKIKQDNNTKIAELEKQIDAQAVMVRDLKNAKDTLFHRVNNLESELNEAKE